VVWVLAFALAACADDAEPPHLVSKSIGVDGGVVSSHDGVLTIVFQAGALTEATTIEIFPSDEPPLVFGPAYRVRPNIPLEIDAEITYSRVLPEDPDDTAISVIRLEDYENENGWWRPLPRIQLDEANNSVLALDSELSLYYALLEDANGPGDDDGEDDVADDVADDDGVESTEDDGPGTEDDGPGTDDSTGEPLLSHAVDIQPIWDTKCLGPGCHEQPAPGGGLVLADDAYAHLVGIFATGANRPLVAPGDPDGSYVVNKLDGTFDDPDVNGSGSRMPLAMNMLSAEEIDLIRAWIEQGAQP
jgi:hypothetical protein